MKNILLITNIYPMLDKEYKGTPVCHFFTKEWQKMGYNVKVVHFETLFPKIYYLIGNVFKKNIRARTGCVVYTKTPRKYRKYNIDNIPVLLVPIFKIIPHVAFSKSRIEKALDIVYKELEKDNFVPDFITGHFALPQLQMLYLMKQKYQNIKTCMVLHSDGSSLQKIYPDYINYMNSIDVWGFRSEAFKNKFELLYGKKENEFICYSGIPDSYIEPVERNFDNQIFHFSFVGSLFKLKRVDNTIKALNQAFDKKNFCFDIVGEGAELSNLTALVESLNLKDNVCFYGQVSRERVQEIIKESDCFIMISSHEAFGLVYVEAMAKGCITIATKGQGIDGVIIDGVNGFLCEAENIEELSNIIRKIRNMSKEDLKKISDNAVEMARNMTDYKVAEHYINSIINC